MTGASVDDLDRLCEVSYLKNVWRKRLRKGLRKMPLGSFQLAADPLDYLAFDWELDANLQSLADDLRRGRYRPERPEFVRAAKSAGLARPLAFLRPNDLIVYVGAIQLIENSLLQQMRPWVRFGRAQSTIKGAQTLESESGWFKAWLARQDQLWVMTNTHEYLVMSDVANFFASLTLDALRDHLHNHGSGSQELTDLLVYLIAELAPRTSYRRTRLEGLPQENFDGSRVLAHTYMGPVDEQFLAEGESNRLSRWVDDFVVGADTREEALTIVSRLQKGLESVDLFPNSSKTRIVQRMEFAREYMKDENDYIGEIENQIKKNGVANDTLELRERIKAHVRMTPRPKAWERVLRRYYTVSKRTKDDFLLRYWDKHLFEVPASASHILEYLTSFRLSDNRVSRLRTLVNKFGDVYEDVPLLILEAIHHAPNVNSLNVRESLSSWSRSILAACFVERARLAASAVLVLAKFGREYDLDFLLELYETNRKYDTPARQQATNLLLSSKRLDISQLQSLTHHSSSRSLQHIRFLETLSDAHNKPTGMAMGHI